MVLLDMRRFYAKSTTGVKYITPIHCPYHEEQTGSCVVFPDLEQFHCFGCGRIGAIRTLPKSALQECIDIVAEEVGRLNRVLVVIGNAVDEQEGEQV